MKLVRIIVALALLLFVAYFANYSFLIFPSLAEGAEKSFVIPIAGAVLVLGGIMSFYASREIIGKVFGNALAFIIVIIGILFITGYLGLTPTPFSFPLEEKVLGIIFSLISLISAVLVIIGFKSYTTSLI